MTEVVSVRFKNRGKLYFFSPNGLDIPENAPVVVETSKGLELADCVYSNHWVTDERIIQPLRPVVRVATEDDLRVARVNKSREKDAFEICQKKIAAHGLDMKLVDVECNFEGNKIIFFFASEGRVDFRELVKDLAGVFRTRIELRQIGVRDEAKMIGGLGICGRPFCCSQFLDDFLPVSTKMAKTQSMSLNPTKISGSCGRLMCCLRYEQEAYEELVKNMPKNGAFVQTPAGYGNVTQINLLRQKIKVRLDGADQAIKTFEVGEVATVPGGRPKPGEPLPSVLTLPSEEETKAEKSEPDVPASSSSQAEPAVAPLDEPEKKMTDGSSEGDEGKSRRSRRRPRPRRPKSAASDKHEQEVSSAKLPQEKKSVRPHQQKKPQQEKKPQPKPDADGAAQSNKNDGRRRYYHRKPKSPDNTKSE
ncbi:MAG: stage 0 sporulation family protein [Oscillospiraceae bacterium]